MLNENVSAQDIWRILARVWSVLLLIYWLLAVVANVPFAAFLELDTGGFMFDVLILMAAIATAIAWRWEWQGGILLLICAVTLGLLAFFSVETERSYAMLVAGGPFLLSAGMFLLCDWCQRKDEEEAEIIAHGV
jgi:hypothetical protein